jgi:hypothetical protein
VNHVGARMFSAVTNASPQRANSCSGTHIRKSIPNFHILRLHWISVIILSSHMSSNFLTQCQAHRNSRRLFRLYEGWGWVCNTVTPCYGGNRVFKCITVKETRQFWLFYFKLLLKHYLVHDFFFTQHVYTWQNLIYKFYDDTYIHYIQHTGTFIPAGMP